MRTFDDSRFALGRLDFKHIDFTGLLALAALIFLFLVVLGLGRPPFAA